MAMYYMDLPMFCGFGKLRTRTTKAGEVSYLGFPYLSSDLRPSLTTGKTSDIFNL